MKTDSKNRLAALLVEFIFHVKRGNLLPYDQSFEGPLANLVAIAEAEFEHPVDPFAPVPKLKQGSDVQIDTDLAAKAIFAALSEDISDRRGLKREGKNRI